MAQFFTWRKGSTLRFYFDVTSGDVTGDEPVRCALKRQKFGEPVGEELVVFDVTLMAAETGNYFEIVADSSASDALAIGSYVADLRIEFDDGEFQSDPIRIQLLERVTEN